MNECAEEEKEKKHKLCWMESIDDNSRRKGLSGE